MIDLHLHSRASDGTLTPAELVAAAAARGVQTLALTDHDNTDGLAAAAEACRERGIRFVPGVEISASWQHKTLHILGLDIDASNPELQAGLAGLRGRRQTRAEDIGRRLEARGIAGAYAGAKQLAGDAPVSRLHFARYLCEQGHARDLQRAFRKFFKRGRPGHVAVTWASLEECVTWIHAAGGQAVLAHPLRYDLSRNALLRMLEAFKQAGGDGIEIVCGRGDVEEQTQAAGYAARFGFAGSLGSDFHAPAPYSQPGIPAELLGGRGIAPIWDRFLN